MATTVFACHIDPVPEPERKCCDSAEVMPDDKVKALALQQMSLNASPQILFFYGACRTEEALMLVYEHIKVPKPPFPPFPFPSPYSHSFVPRYISPPNDKTFIHTHNRNIGFIRGSIART